MYKGSPDSCKKVIKIVSGLIHHKPCNVHKLRNILYISYLLTLSNTRCLAGLRPAHCSPTGLVKPIGFETQTLPLNPQNG